MWNAPGLPIPNMCAAFSAMGSPVIMPLRPEDGYAVEFAMFGGGTQGKAPNGGSRECGLQGWERSSFTQQRVCCLGASWGWGWDGGYTHIGAWRRAVSGAEDCGWDLLGMVGSPRPSSALGQFPGSKVAYVSRVPVPAHDAAMCLLRFPCWWCTLQWTARASATRRRRTPCSGCACPAPRTRCWANGRATGSLPTPRTSLSACPSRKPAALHLDCAVWIWMPIVLIICSFSCAPCPGHGL